MKDQGKRTMDYDLLDQTDSRHVGNEHPETPTPKVEKEKKKPYQSSATSTSHSSTTAGHHKAEKEDRTIDYGELEQTNDRHVRGNKE